MQNEAAVAYWKALFDELKLETNATRREDMLSMVVAAAARHRIVFDVPAVHPCLDEIRHAFSRYPAGLNVTQEGVRFENPFGSRAPRPIAPV